MPPARGAPAPAPDPETGIGDLGDDEVRKAITEAVAPGGQKPAPPMPCMFFADMTDDDLDTVIACLRRIPPVKNAVERTEFRHRAFP